MTVPHPVDLRKTAAEDGGAEGVVASERARRRVRCIEVWLAHNSTACRGHFSPCSMGVGVEDGEKRRMEGFRTMTVAPSPDARI